MRVTLGCFHLTHTLSIPRFHSTRSDPLILTPTYLFLILSLPTIIESHLYEDMIRFAIPTGYTRSHSHPFLAPTFTLTPSPSLLSSSCGHAPFCVCRYETRPRICVSHRILTYYSCRTVLYIFYIRTTKSPRSYHRSRRILTHSPASFRTQQYMIRYTSDSMPHFTVATAPATRESFLVGPNRTDTDGNDRLVTYMFVCARVCVSRTILETSRCRSVHSDFRHPPTPLPPWRTDQLSILFTICTACPFPRLLLQTRVVLLSFIESHRQPWGKQLVTIESRGFVEWVELRKHTIHSQTPQQSSHLISRLLFDESHLTIYSATTSLSLSRFASPSSICARTLNVVVSLSCPACLQTELSFPI